MLEFFNTRGAPGSPSFSQSNSGGAVRTVKIICNGTSVKVWIDDILRFDIIEAAENINTYVGHRFYNNAYIDEISFEKIEASGTAIGSALAVATNRMRESQSKTKVVIRAHPEWIGLQAVEAGIHRNYPSARFI